MSYTEVVARRHSLEGIARRQTAVRIGRMSHPTIQISTTDPTELADRYVALWNEPDAERRRAAVAALWTDDGAHVLQPPREMRAAAAAPGVGLTARLEARGHAALEVRAKSAHDAFVAARGFTFRRRDDVDRLDDVIKFTWEMVSRDGEVAGAGLEVLVLALDGRIRIDHQFIEG
jgi:hypothetical protein